jgi:hypothetical protein
MKNIFIFSTLLFAFSSTIFCQKNIINWPDNYTSIIGGHAKMDFSVTNETLHAKTDEKGIFWFSINIPEKSRDISGNTKIIIPVANKGDSECIISAMLDEKGWTAGAVVLQPGQSDNIEIVFLHEVDKTIPAFSNMDGVPGGGLYIWDPIDPANLASIKIEVQAIKPVSVSFEKIVATGNYSAVKQVASQTGFFPFIDIYGQFMHDDWPGKTYSDEDLARSLEMEKAELSLLDRPENFNKYGGWKNGPELTATGNFYVTKIDGAWWMVDPEGRLFWSHGVNCVGFGSGNTQVEGREYYFTKLPENVTRVNFYTDNLARKFSTGWQDAATSHIHKRLSSWGINTIANWSDAGVYLSARERTPYTANISYRSPALDGASFKFPDVFDPRFRESLEEGIKRAAANTADDSWCIGYFIDNELMLGNFDNFANVVMMQDTQGYAKKALIGFLENRYKSIGNLNSAYGTRYRSWVALRGESSLPETARKDMAEFNLIIIDKYYSTCRNALKEAIPHKLYLGNRFNLYRIYYPKDTLINDIIKAAGEYCDVVSINYYRYSSEDLILPEGIDKPIIIGEFHFGALDRGLPHTGLRNAANQEQRATLYEYYLEKSLQNPQIVGTHWFQYGDQPYTGRFDGENYQIGFVDICDTPYPETVRALRKIGYNMYNFRKDNFDIDQSITR